MTIIDFLQTQNISFSFTKNVGAEYISIQCPFCSDNSFHGCIHKTKIYYNCWICGWRPIENVLAEITDLSFSEIKNQIKKFQNQKIVIKKEKRKAPKSIVIPGGKLSTSHKKYLRARNFNPDYLEKKYKIKGSSHIGEYKFRIMIPIFFDGKLVSYQGRDITNKSEMRYKACHKKNEIIQHKHILYNIDNALSEIIIIVEGITDVWRLGDGAVATFGTSFTQEQINLIIKKKYKKVFIIYDPNAEQKANDLSDNLNLFGIKTIIIYLENKDPGGLNEQEAKKLLKDIYAS